MAGGLSLELPRSKGHMISRTEGKAHGVLTHTGPIGPFALLPGHMQPSGTGPSIRAINAT